MEFKLNDYNRNVSDEELLSDIKRVAEQLGQTTLTMDEYNASGKFSSSTIRNRFNGWQNALQLAGLKIGLNRNFTDEDLFQEIERIWRTLGRQPTSTDIKDGISKYSLNSYSRRFGGWRSALQAFVDYINADDDDKIADTSTEVDSVIEQPQNIPKHTTKRDVNLRLRFRVLSRDNFKCCACGASPAKKSSVKLHVDHIHPWSKGGETVIENLQTLCQDCNLGKSNL